ncbi:LysR family transcriptional regulator [Macrococcoides caseolyticum]|uniref:LysR family transcriptional regulator n=1 Tax=Macrococcoides caseolyticum TaxID=69966 RepID=UPI001F404956|nr:LysR family transcriptional regulator [Macrococcus caseolyticus]MCE4956411.1 LysR family transcriptional regulator [Macrococcus caseolyticus]
MKILHFEYYIAVVEYKSFTKASAYLHISQPSLTAAIKKLENELGYQLLMRSTKDVKITERGILFYQYAKEIVHKYHQTVEQMYDLNYSNNPKIKIGILESTSKWVSTVVSQHSNMYEGQHYMIKEILSTDEIASAITRYDVHVALSNEQLNHNDVISVPIYSEDYILTAPIDTFPDIKSIQLKGLPLILPNDTFQVRKHLNDYFMRHEIRPQIVLEVDRFETALNYVHAGMGYAVIPKIYYQSNNASHLSAIAIHPNISRTIYINYHKKRKHSDRVLSLIDAFIQYWDFDGQYET